MAANLIYHNDLERLRGQIKNGTLDAVEYPHEQQTLLVRNAIRDFANLGFWDIDGRAR